MKKSIKFLSIAVIAIVSILAVTLMGCSNLGKCAEFDLQGQDKLGKKAPVLNVATNAEFAPFEYMEGSNIVGYDMALINAIGSKIGMKVVVKNMEFDSIITSVQSQKGTIGIAGITETEERAKAVSFTDNYFGNNQVMVVKKGNTKFDAAIKLANAAGKDGPTTAYSAVIKLLENTTIHTARGQAGQYFAEGGAGNPFGYVGIAGANVKTYDSVGVAAQGIKGDEVALFDKQVAKKFVDNNATNFAYVDFNLTEENYSIAINKGDTELLAKINKALAELTADGTVKTIKEFYGVVTE